MLFEAARVPPGLLISWSPVKGNQMPKLIEKPTIIDCVGTKPKQIQEFAGRVNSGWWNTLTKCMNTTAVDNSLPMYIRKTAKKYTPPPMLVMRWHWNDTN